jgi:predicted secreted protein
MDENIIKVKSQEEFSIDINELPGAGYLSKVKIDSQKLNLHAKVFPNAKPFEKIDPKDAVIGGANLVRYTFSTKEVGEFSIEIRLIRPWIGESEDDEVFIYKVIAE